MPMRAALVLALGTLAAGCSEGTIALELPSAASAPGAGVQGTVVNVGLDASSGTAASTGITVRVVGTSSVTTTDGEGRFLLSGLPEGAITLRFQGSDCDAAVEVAGLANGRTVSIRVRVSGSQAALQG